MMTVLEIIQKYLKDNGYDGLAGDECGCGFDNLATCDTPLACNPGWKCPKPGPCSEWEDSDTYYCALRHGSDECIAQVKLMKDGDI